MQHSMIVFKENIFTGMVFLITLTTVSNINLTTTIYHNLIKFVNIIYIFNLVNKIEFGTYLGKKIAAV